MRATLAPVDKACCAGCGQALEHGAPLFEVACEHIYCVECVVPGIAGVGDCTVLLEEA